MPTDPDCRPGGEKNRGYHLADGGYYDNYGVVTILEYLIEIRQQWFKDENLSAMRKVAALFPNSPSE